MIQVTYYPSVVQLVVGSTSSTSYMVQHLVPDDSYQK